MVLEALRLTGRRGGSQGAGVYDKEFVGPLNDWWERLAGGEAWPDEQAKARITALAKLTIEGLQQQIPSAGYRPENLGDRVRPVAEYIGEGQSYPSSGIEIEKLTLRDVMNSAWVARMTFSTPPRDIARPAIDLCKQVLNKKPGDRRSKATAASSGRPGPMS
jgi:hypothetical protein